MEFVNILFNHQAEFFEFHRKKYKNAKKRSLNTKTALEN